MITRRGFMTVLGLGGVAAALGIKAAPRALASLGPGVESCVSPFGVSEEYAAEVGKALARIRRTVKYSDSFGLYPLVTDRWVRTRG